MNDYTAHILLTELANLRRQWDDFQHEEAEHDKWTERLNIKRTNLSTRIGDLVSTLDEAGLAHAAPKLNA